MAMVEAVPKLSKVLRQVSQLEDALAFQFRAIGLEPEREYSFLPERKWRLDFAFPERKIGIECEGGVWTQGRHNRGQGFIDDCDKYNAAGELGWRIFRYTAKQIKSGVAWQQIERIVGSA